MAGSAPTRADFYVVSGPGERVARVACRLAEKVYESGQTAFIRVPDQQGAEQLDALLWSFREDSFIPHRRADQGNEQGKHNLPIIIGEGEATPARDVLINISAHSEPAPERFERIAEVFSESDENARTQARERWRHYQERGFTLKNHKV